MKHARDDYNRIQDPAHIINDNEPVFLLRAQDELAAQAVAYYAWLCRKAGITDIADLADAHSELMRAWPIKKRPDLPLSSQKQE